MKLFLSIIALLVLLGIGMSVYEQTAPPGEEEEVVINSFEECVAAGNPVMESYPEQCRTEDGLHFVRDIGNELAKADLIRLSSPRPGDTISSPLIIEGEARGFWFFEADFPVILTDWNGLIVAEHFASSTDDWMTENFVPFISTIEFEVPTSTVSNRGTLILRKHNASGLPEHDDALEIPVFFEVDSIIHTSIEGTVDNE